MKNTKIFLILFVLISALIAANKSASTKLISSNIHSTVVEFNLQDFSLVPIETPNGLMYIPKFDNSASLLIKGAPNIQKYSKSIIIPDDSEMEIKIISSEYTEYTDIIIAPSKGNLSRLINPDNIPYEYGKEYTNDAFFPTSIASLQETYILRDLRGVTIDFYPINYNPIKNILRVYSNITVEVFSTNNNASNKLNRKSNKQTLSNEFKNIYEDHFLNFSSDNRFDYLDDHGNMLIISYNSFIDAMQPFVDWKNKKGIPTEIVNVSDIGSNTTAIKNYINNYYYENGLTFLLLVGDVAQIPSPTISGSASDPSYGFIEGNDSYAEVIVGRFSGSTPAHIITQVERSIAYERFPQANADWYDNTMGIASTQGPGYGGYTDAEFNDFLWDTILSDFTYDSYQYSYDGSGSVSQGMGIINNGISLINYTGHGSIGSWGNGAPLSSSNVNSLTNNNKLPFVISVACNTGEFNSTNECFAESWLRATNNNEPSGGVAFFGSTISMSWEPPMHGQMAMNLILTESYENHITRSMGGIATNGCLYMNDAQGASGINETNYWTFFGDPSLEIRSDQPASLNISHDAAIIVGQSELTVNTGTNNALVAISKDNELLTFAYSNNGIANLNLTDSNLLPGDYDLVVTSFNAYPYETSISVIAPEGPYVTFDSYTLNDGFSIGGNDNGIAEFDETISLSIQANNVGVDNANNVYAQITINDPFITLYDNNIQFGNIAANASTNAGSINFSIAHNVPDGHMATFNISFFSTEGQWENSFNVPISAPLLTVSNPTFIDAGGDGIWDAGESIIITILLNNEGSAAHYSYPGIYLSEESTEASIDEGLEFFWFYGIEPGTTVPATFSVSASNDANMGSEVIFTSYADELNCEQNCITSEPITFTFPIGLPFDDNLYEPLNLVATTNINSIDLSWDEPFTCPVGQFADCIGQCIDDWYEAWLGDGLCDDGTWGVYFNCDEFNNDGGDCGDVLTCEDQGLFTCPNGTCESAIEDCPETSCESGYVDDCTGDGDCCPESWIGDGFADCEDQAYGCDLTCYDNDGGDCGGRNNNNSNIKLNQMYPSRVNADFSNALILPSNTRDVNGFFVYRNDNYIAFTEELSYNDVDISNGMEYCYHITAVYDEGQSEPSNTACAIAEGDQGIAGDLNGDEVLNILDIIILANMVIGTADPQESADLNGDGVVNILDVITLVNMVLNGREIHTSSNLGKNAILYENAKSAYISSDGEIAGIQLVINATDIKINNDIPLTIATNYNDSKYTILIYGANGETISGDKIQLFTTTSNYEIKSIIIANTLSKSMEIQRNSIQPNIYTLNQNYPNPFNPNTMIQFSVGKDEFISLNIFDINGRLIKSLINNTYYMSGSHKITWDGKSQTGSQAPSGMYIYKLISNNQTISKKMLLMK